jgi:TIR domain
MATIWITYSWADNTHRDVDFAAQELEAAGLTVKLDRWNIGAGRRLWEQIEEFIQDPRQSDAWLLYATQASLGSEACKEEYAYALDRALKTRGGAFSVIGLFPATVNETLIPAGVRTRLYVSLRDPDWKERVVAAASGRAPKPSRPHLEPFFIAMHPAPGGEIAIEVRPRAGTWAPFIAAVPTAEVSAVNPRLMHGPAGCPTTVGALFSYGTGTHAEWSYQMASNEATPTMSYYVTCAVRPSKLHFGVNNGMQYTVDISRA